jgi:phage terminase small subunit
MADWNGLTDKQKVFVEKYLECWNGAEAAREAGYAFPRRSAYENLTNPDIRRHIEQRLHGYKMSADEVLTRLSEQARFDIGSLLGKGGVIDWDTAKEQGLTQHLKSISWTKDGLRVEAYSKQHALELLGKAHALFTDRKDITSGGQPLKGYTVLANPDLWDDGE